MNLVVEVGLYQPRWYGAKEWPPSPMRLFQALLAGACLGRAGAAEGDLVTLRWLAGLGDPMIAAPPEMVRGARHMIFMASNDLDAIGGQIPRIAEIRESKKVIHPYLFGRDGIFLFVWPLGTAETGRVAAVADLAGSLYQFGRGVDMAWSSAALLGAESLAERLRVLGSQVWFPGASGSELRCATEDSLASLQKLHAEAAVRSRSGLLQQPGPPTFRLAHFGSPWEQTLYELRRPQNGDGFASWSAAGTVLLATIVRDAMVARLRRDGAYADRELELFVVGRGAAEADKSKRIQIIPLPSIGTVQTEASIRRVLVRRPPDCPIRSDDAAWAFSGVDLGVDHSTGEIRAEGGATLTPADDGAMLGHYGVDKPARVWHSVTAVVLPVRRRPGKASAARRLETEAAAFLAVRQALRHVGVVAEVESVRVQKEPFWSKGERAEAFASAPRFDAARLWHCRITFARAVPGPLVLGDGRYLGLGLMAPASGQDRDALLFSLPGGCRPSVSQREVVARAVRRALMSRAAAALGEVPTLFSGHEIGAGPARGGQHRHVYVLALDEDGDGLVDCVMVLAPWRVDRSWMPPKRSRDQFEAVVSELSLVRAGGAGLLKLEPAREPDLDHCLFAPARAWVSLTPYAPTVPEARGNRWAELAARDIRQECGRRGLPPPQVEILGLVESAGGGASINARLRFPAAVPGPIVLGRTAHLGGGVFQGGGGADRF